MADSQETPRGKFTVTRELRLSFTHGMYQGIVTVKNTEVDPRSMYFRIRTNAQKNYVVRPAAGFLERGLDSNIVIYLKSVGNLQERLKDKFQVQMIYCTEFPPKTDAKSILERFHGWERSEFKNTIASEVISVYIEYNDNVEQQMQRNTSVVNSPTPVNFVNDSFSVPKGNDETSSMKEYQNFLPPSIHYSGGLQSSLPAHKVYSAYNGTKPEILDNLATSRTKEFASPPMTRKSIASEKNIAIASADGQLISHVNDRILDDRVLNGYADTINFSRDSMQNPNMSFQEKHYYSQVGVLKREYAKNQDKLNSIKRERDGYLNELQKLQFTTNQNEMITPPPPKTVQQKSVQLWHLLLVSVIFLIFGSLMRS
jgi:Tfp pilus assembly protein PilE